MESIETTTSAGPDNGKHRGGKSLQGLVERVEVSRVQRVRPISRTFRPMGLDSTLV